jgi:hypothetical protein
MQESRPSDSVPQSYDEFVAGWYDRVKAIVLAFPGIDKQDAEDITQNIIMQFIAEDYLQIYDADKQAKIAEQRNADLSARYEAGELLFKPAPVKGKFSSYVYQFVKVRLLGIRDARFRRLDREGLSFDTFFEPSQESDSDSSESLTAWVGKVDVEFFNMELRDLLKDIYEKLCKYTQRTPTRDLPVLFQTIVTETFMNPDGFNKQQYADSRGITPSAVQMQIKDMRSFCYGFNLESSLHEVARARMRGQESHRK